MSGYTDLRGIAKRIRDPFAHFTDPRKGKNIRYARVGAGLSAFSVFLVRSPSFWEDQRSLDQRLGKNNVQILFGVHEIPWNNPIRHLLDANKLGDFSYFFHIFNVLSHGRCGGDLALAESNPVAGHSAWEI